MRIKMLRPVRHIGRWWNLEKDKEYEIDEGDASFLIQEGYAEQAGSKPAQKLENRAKPSSLTPQKLGTLTALNRFQGLVDNDYIEIFAPAGHGKSRLLAHTALEAKRAGKKVVYLDCEHSLPERIEKELGDSYRRLDFMNLDRIIDAIANLPKGYDLVCYDSVGFPVLIKFVKMSMRERGDAIQKTILLRGYLKHYAETNKALAIGTNQPVSELYGMSHELEDLEKRPPVGGKSIHIAKAVLRMEIIRQIENRESVFGLLAFEVQDMPFNRKIAEFSISGEKSNEKTELRWL